MQDIILQQKMCSILKSICVLIIIFVLFFLQWNLFPINLISYFYLILYQHKSLLLFFLMCLLLSMILVSHRPSSSPTQMLAPVPEGALWTPASTSSVGEGSGTYSRHRTAEPTCRLFTALGMGLLRENISICHWEPSPPATCREKKTRLKKVKTPC